MGTYLLFTHYLANKLSSHTIPNKHGILLSFLSFSFRNYYGTCTLGSPCLEGAVIVDRVVEGEREDKEGTLAGCVHAEWDVLLV